jgi:hypothetical protein
MAIAPADRFAADQKKKEKKTSRACNGGCRARGAASRPQYANEAESRVLRQQQPAQSKSAVARVAD